MQIINESHRRVRELLLSFHSDSEWSSISEDMGLPLEEKIRFHEGGIENQGFPSQLLEGNQDAFLGMDPASSIIGNMQGTEEYILLNSDMKTVTAPSNTTSLELSRAATLTG